ncbi:hypothetical protein BSL78_22004 [Apostichopus japonicus]|uniref:Uncharacterized protein n=1 Tax=Stichopus japonicus TaxID=307972 RepID=A0A2G8JZH9_STIJA|nr:hypothetical protein BSL78_22004 [Apostichopus japonicus]
MEPTIMSMADVQHMQEQQHQQQQQQQVTSQAHILQGTVPQSLAGTSLAYTQCDPISTHHGLTPVSSGLLPLPTSVVQYQVAPSGVAPTTLVVATQEPTLRMEQHFNNGKDRDPRPASHLRTDSDSRFGRRRRFREEFELDDKPLKSLRTSEFERSLPFSARYKELRAEGSRELGMRGGDIFGRRRRFQEAGDARTDYEFPRDRDLRVTRFSDSTDRRLMPPPPPSRITATAKPILSSQKMQQQGFRHPGQVLGDGSSSSSLVSYENDSDSDSDEPGAAGFGLRSSQKRFDMSRGISQSPPMARGFEQQSSERRYGQPVSSSRFSPPSSPLLHEMSRHFLEQRRSGSRGIDL